MRIVGGIHKGRRFSPPGNFRARPTTDIAKESLFNVLSNYIDFEDITAADLFSGTGSISYELASRGCKNIVSVEKDYYHHKFILKCIEELKLQQIIKPIIQDVFSYIKNPEFSGFDLIFADPPFNLHNLNEIPHLIMESNLLNSDGIFILEHGNEYDYSSMPYFWQVRHYGKICFTFFKLQTNHS